MNVIEFVYLDNCYVKRIEGLAKYKKIKKQFKKYKGYGNKN